MKKLLLLITSVLLINLINAADISNQITFINNTGIKLSIDWWYNIKKMSTVGATDQEQTIKYPKTATYFGVLGKLTNEEDISRFCPLNAKNIKTLALASNPVKIIPGNTYTIDAICSLVDRTQGLWELNLIVT